MDGHLIFVSPPPSPFMAVTPHPLQQPPSTSTLAPPQKKTSPKSFNGGNLTFVDNSFDIKS